MRHQPLLPRSPNHGLQPMVDTAQHSEGPTSGWACKVFGHDMTFQAEDRSMRWSCTRGCEAGGAKEYPTSEEAAHFAAAFDKRENRDLGKRAPLIGLLPLRLWHRLHNNQRAEGSRHVQ